VVRTATRGRRAHGTSAIPSEASTPSSAGPSSVPAGTATSPARTSSPARRTFRPGAVSGTLTRPSSASARSRATTASAPRGNTAPVEITMASPARSGRSAGRPARDSPTSASSPPGPATVA
jgi:hypothetical protein